MMRNLFILITLLIIIGGCNANKDETEQNSDDLSKITQIADAYVELAIEFYPENYAYFSAQEQDHSRLSDNSLVGLERWNLAVDSLYNCFKKLPVEQEVGSESWYLYGFLKETLESDIQTRDCKTEFAAVNQLSGWHIRFTGLAGNQPVGTEKAREQAINRWSRLPGYVDNEISNLRTGIRQGYTVPKSIVKTVIQQLDELLAKPVLESQFYSPANRDTSIVFKKEWESLVKTTIYPAIKNYHTFLKNDYYPKARNSISLADLPNGKKAYEAYYRYFTSVKRETKEIIEIADYRLKVNNSKLRLYGRERYGNDSIPQVLNQIIQDTTHYFNSREEMIRFAEEVIVKAKEKCKISFEKLPSQEVEIRVIPENSQLNIGSHYMPAIGDSTKPSYYYIDLDSPTKKMRGELETEIFHETFPGHHLQFGLEAGKKSNHLITRFFAGTSYIEGWASYAQILADELGLYKTGYSRFYVLGRSCRIMHLEAMIHSGKWDRKQAIDYLLTRGTRSEAAERIIDRIVAWPGQYSTYDTGLLEILELREKAMLTLGDDFDIKEFHKIVLDGGAIPLEMLRQKVNWWLKKKTQK